ncbi:pantothenate metabolism flavoprotein [Fibrobacterales bacterium]|nr:pantothenate metabolism flavoprotein [Fibrobacterales bacterium]
MDLHGKKILLGVTGGIAAYKACELLRVFQKRGAEVRVVMTKAAQSFVGQTTFAALSNFPVYVETAAVDSKPFQHIDYPRWADIFVVAPCSATSIARFTGGTGEEPLSLCFLAMQGEKWIVPAMNFAMYSSPAVQRNLELLKSFEVNVIEPEVGRLACGEKGAGKFPNVNDIADIISFSFGSVGEFPKNRSVLITIGRTEEAIDPVRYISNRSSGKTGAAIVRKFLQNGFRVIAVCGKMEVDLPKQCEVIKVLSAEEMNRVVLEKQSEATVIIHAAAVADYRPKNAAEQKIKDSRAIKNLELEENPNILKNTIKNKSSGQVIVSFALETENAIENALKKIAVGGIDILVVNNSVNFGKDFVEFAILGQEAKNNAQELKLGSKEELAEKLFLKANAKLLRQ